MKLKLFVLGTMLCASVGLKAMNEAEEILPDYSAIVDVVSVDGKSGKTTTFAKVSFGGQELCSLEREIINDNFESNKEKYNTNNVWLQDLVINHHLKKCGKEAPNFGIYDIYKIENDEYIVKPYQL